MKSFWQHAFLCVALCLFVPADGRAEDKNIIDAQSGGAATASVSTDGVMQLSQLLSYIKPQPQNPPILGDVIVMTGPLVSGSLTSTVILGGGIFSSTGSTFQVIGNGTNGVPDGMIFDGAFTGNIQWEFLNRVQNLYMLYGHFSGKLTGHGTVSGITSQSFLLIDGVFVPDGGNINFDLK